MRRIAYYVHGRGRGHASRALTLVPVIQELGYELRLYGGRHADDLLSHLPEYRRVAPVTPGFSGARALPGRLIADRKELKGFRPHLVISDGDLPSILTAKSIKAPTLAIGHDLIFWRCRLPDNLPPKSLRAERRSGFIANRARFGIAVHFLPTEVISQRTRLARPTLRPQLAGPTRLDDHILCYFRDPIGREVLSRATATGAKLIAFGDELGSIRKVRTESFEIGRFGKLLRSCKAVIASAGSNLLAECILLGKPVMALHRKGDPEQTLNSIMIERAGVGARGLIETVGAHDIERFLLGVESKRFVQIDLAGEVPDLHSVAADFLGEILT